MTKTGRKPTPAKIKELRGTTRADRMVENELDHSEDIMLPTLPKPPNHLNEWGQKAWINYGNLLLEHGLLTSADLIALEMLASSYGRWIRAEEDLRDQGDILISERTGSPYQNPLRGVANTAWGQVKQMLSEFGLTPAERTRVASLVADKRDVSMEEILLGSKVNY